MTERTKETNSETAIKVITTDRFEVIVSAYGSDPDHWPDEERAAALSFAKTEAGKALLSDAKSLDRCLDLVALKPAAVDDGYLDRVMRAVDHLPPALVAATQPADSDDTSVSFIDYLKEMLGVSRLTMAIRAGALTVAGLMGIALGASNITSTGYATATIDASQLAWDQMAPIADIKTIKE